MWRNKAALVGIAMTGFTPVPAVYAAELASLALPEAFGTAQAHRAPSANVAPAAIAAPAPVAVPSQSGGIRSEARSIGLRIGRYAMSVLDPEDVDAPRAVFSAGVGDYRYDRWAAGGSHPEDYRYGLSGIESALRVAPTSVMNRVGWGWSGRVGPVRWLGPIDGEGGETLLRLGRVPGQPSIQAGGKIRVGIHYTFE
jgi:hypothetical protein